MATLFIHGVGNTYGDLFAERIEEIVAPQLRAALRRAGRPDEPHVRGVYWGGLSGAAVPGGSPLGERDGLRLVVLQRLRLRLAEPDARILMIGLGLAEEQLVAAADDALSSRTTLRVDQSLGPPGAEFTAGVVARLRSRGLLPAAGTELDDLRALLEQVGSFGASNLGALGRQPEIPLAVDSVRAGRKPLLDVLLGGWSEMQAYLGPSGQAIRDHVADAISASGAAHPAEPLRIIGHSLGGVIAFDILNSGEHPFVDLLVTAGSQVGLLAEHGLIRGQRPPSSTATLDSPPGVGRWVNVYDTRDPLAFEIAGVAAVDGRAIVDLPLEGGAPWPHSHSAYWSRPLFYDLLARYY